MNLKGNAANNHSYPTHGKQSYSVNAKHDYDHQRNSPGPVDYKDKYHEK